MLDLSQTRKAIKTLLLGDAVVPEEFATGIPDPQSEIAVWLHGMGQPIDVTYRQSTVCSSPFRICVAFLPDRIPTPTQLNRLALKFCERDWASASAWRDRTQVDPDPIFGEADAVHFCRAQRNELLSAETNSVSPLSSASLSHVDKRKHILAHAHVIS